MIEDQTKDDDIPFLGVASSLSGKRWQRRKFIPRHAASISASQNIPLIVAEVLSARGVSPQEAAAYLNPSLKDDLPDPLTIVDMDRAIERIARAVTHGQTLAVFGDYDVDGATSSSLLLKYFDAIGVKCLCHIPDRMREGYGPNAPALLSLGRAGAGVVITVDCGTMAFEPLKAAAGAGIDVIVVDHHKAEPVLPDAVAVVNPNRLDDDSGLGQLAAVGVAFMVLIALQRKLREDGFFQGRQEPNLINSLDLVALGTVCDVVPLTGVNRIFVTQGLKVMAKRQNTGLVALSDVGRVNEAPNIYHLGFILGPRLNAGGRVGEAPLGTKLLTCNDSVTAHKIAEQLDGYNEARRAIELDVLDAAIEQIERKYQGDTPPVIAFAAGKGWHSGVVGIVASRLKDKYGVPSLVIGIEEGLAKGSARSISGVDFGAAIIEALQQGLLEKGGGHAMAAGLSLAASGLSELETFLEEFLRVSVTRARQNSRLLLDGVVAPGAVNADLVDVLDGAGPFGVGNPGPRFAVENIALIAADRVGQNHVRCYFKGRDGARFKAVAFRMADEPMGEVLLTGVGRHFHVVGRLKKDDWNGRGQAEMTLEDAAIIGPS